MARAPDRITTVTRMTAFTRRLPRTERNSAGHRANRRRHLGPRQPVARCGTRRARAATPAGSTRGPGMPVGRSPWKSRRSSRELLPSTLCSDPRCTNTGVSGKPTMISSRSTCTICWISRGRQDKPRRAAEAAPGQVDRQAQQREQAEKQQNDGDRGHGGGVPQTALGQSHTIPPPRIAPKSHGSRGRGARTSARQPPAPCQCRGRVLPSGPRLRRGQEGWNRPVHSNRRSLKRTRRAVARLALPLPAPAAQPHFESPQLRQVMQPSIMTTAAVLHFVHSCAPCG